MKIVYLLYRDPDDTLKKIMEQHIGGHEVTVVNMNESKDYGHIMELVAASDKVITW